MNGHGFEASDVPGVFVCRRCAASAHYDRDERRYCVHPAELAEPAVVVGPGDGSWGPIPEGVHRQERHHWTAVM